MLLQLARFMMAVSAEPGRKAPYGADLRWRVVWNRLVYSLKFADIGKRLGIATSTAHRIFTEYMEAGDVEPKREGHRHH